MKTIGRRREFALLLALCVGCSIPIPPAPTPDPEPIVVTNDATLIVIEESSHRPPDVATVLGDVAFWSSLGVKWRIYDDDSPDAVVYLSMEKSRPGLIVLDRNGTKIWGGPLPKTTDEIKRLLK